MPMAPAQSREMAKREFIETGWGGAALQICDGASRSPIFAWATYQPSDEPSTRKVTAHPTTGLALGWVCGDVRKWDSADAIRITKGTKAQGGKAAEGASIGVQPLRRWAGVVLCEGSQSGSRSGVHFGVDWPA